MKVVKKWFLPTVATWFLSLGFCCTVCMGDISKPFFDYLSIDAYGDLATMEPAGYFAVGTRYIHPPIVEWESVADAASYDISLVQKDKILGVTEANSSPKKIENGWDQIKPGKAAVVIQAFDKDGKRIALSRLFPFYVAPDFDKKNSAAKKRTYKQAAMKVFEALDSFKLPDNTPAPAEGPGSKIHQALLSACGNKNSWANRSFPVLHDPIHVDMVEALMKIADEGQKQKLINYARSAADHMLMCRLPDDYTYGGMIRGCADYNGQGILGVLHIADTEQAEQLTRVVEPAKTGWAGEALVKVYEITGDKKYLDAAGKIAEVLVRTQRVDGDWPARVDGKTGEVLGDYCSSAVTVASFMERLNKHLPDKKWIAARDKTWQWMAKNPIKTHAWVVNYDDGLARATSDNPYIGLSNWDLFSTVRYISRHIGEIDNAKEIIADQLEWNDNHFVFYGSDPLLSFEPFYPTCAEQGTPHSFSGRGSCWTPMDFHTANWGWAMLEAYKATGNTEYLEKAKAAANALTQYQLDDGRTMTWMCDKTFGLSAHLNGTAGRHSFWPSGWAMSATLWAELAALEQQKTPCSAYPEFSWDTVPVFAHMCKNEGDFTQEEAEFLAKNFPLIAIEKSQAVGSGNTKTEDGIYRAAKQIKAINPKAKVLFYFNITIDFTMYRASETFQAHPEWAKKDKEGNFIKWHGGRRKAYDVSNPEARQWWTDVCLEAVTKAPIDGIFADAIEKHVALEEANRIKWGDAKYEAVKAGLIETMQLAQKKIGPDKLFIFNGLFARPDWWPHYGLPYLKYADGAMAEHFGAFGTRDANGAIIPERMQADIEMVQEAARQGKIICVKGWPGDFTWINEKYKGLSHAEKVQLLKERITFPLAAFLIAAEKYNYFGYAWGYGAEDGWLEDFDEFKRPLGQPKSPAKKDGWIYTREFEHASVWLDIENEEAKIDWH